MKKLPHSMNKYSGFTLVELLVAMVLGVSIMAGVMQVLVASKSNFTSARELAAIQENARFAIKFLSDEIRMAGFSGCNSGSQQVANTIKNSWTVWYTDGLGMQGYEQNTAFPFSGATPVANSDAIIIRRASGSGLRLNGSHNSNSARITVTEKHGFTRGKVLVVASPDCQQIGIFKVKGPANINGNAYHVVHNTGGVTENCTKRLGGNFTCASGARVKYGYPQGSSLMELKSTAFYVGTSSVGNGIPALYREGMQVDTSDSDYPLETKAEELIQGIENMQILYGLDNSLSDGIADIYLSASGVADWSNVVSIRLSLRIRSIYSVYSEDVSYGTFEGVLNTGGADRFMRQAVTTTIQIRN